MLRRGRRKRPAGAINVAGSEQVVLQVLPDAGHVAPNANAKSRQPGARAQTGSHHYRRRSDDPGGQNDSAPGIEAVAHAALQCVDPDCASAVVEGKPVDEQAWAQIEVRSRANGLRQVGIGHALPPTIHNRKRIERRPRQVPPVVVADGMEPELLSGRAVSTGERVRPGGLAKSHGTLPAIALFGGEGRGFRTNEVGPERGPVPSRSAVLGPLVEVSRMAAHMTHGIHRAGPAHHAPARPGMCASCHGALRHGLEIPVDLGALQKRPGGRIGDVGVLGFSARLQQENAEVWPLAKPRGKHAACRPGTHDDEIRLGHACAKAFGPGRRWPGRGTKNSGPTCGPTTRLDASRRARSARCGRPPHRSSRCRRRSGGYGSRWRGAGACWRDARCCQS